MVISVALCSFNGARFLQDQLDSILRQSLAVSEIVICDDGSTDDTLPMIKRYQAIYPEVIKLEINEKNLGPRKNFEKAIFLTKGDIIFLADQDDIWPLNKVSSTVECLHQNTDALGVFTNGHLINQQGKEIGLDLWTSFHFTSKMQEQLNRHTLFRMILQNWTIVTGATLAIKKEAKELILPFQHMSEMWHDEWVAYRLASADALVPLNKNLFCYRIHSDQQIGVYNLSEVLMRAQRREAFFFHTTLGQQGFQSIGFKAERLKIAKRVCSYFPQKKEVIRFLENDLAKEKKRVFDTLSFFKRKLLLLKWVFERRNSTSIHELVSL